MTKKGIFVFVLVSLAVIGALLLTQPQRMISPGKLDPAHVELTTDCFACHKAFTGAASEKCTACHSVDKIGILIPTRRTFDSGGTQAPQSLIR